MIQVEDVRSLYIVTKPRMLTRFLSILKDAGRISKKELKKKTKEHIRGGSYTATLRDARNLKLITNGGSGIEINDEGLTFLREPTPEFLKQKALMIPIFNDMFLAQINERSQAEQFIKKRLGSHYSSSIIDGLASQIALRYLEYIWNKTEDTRRYRGKRGIIQQQLVNAVQEVVKKEGDNHLIRAFNLLVKAKELYKQGYRKDEIKEAIELAEKL